ncbi:hypothetical protein GW17_00051111 [Ensete ventricosum]|nr:hypothetical protein GW17_00051111 [Ensete ventricosum]
MKKSTVSGRLKKKKGKEEEKKKEEVPGRRPRLRAARVPSPSTGRPRAVAARGSPTRRRRPCSPRATIVVSLRWERDRGDTRRRLVFMHGRARRCLVFPREDEASLVLQLRDEAHLVFPRRDEAAPRFPAGRRSVTSSSNSGMRQCLVFLEGRGVA